MQFRFVNDNHVYDGQQLRSLYAYLNYGVLGDSTLAWVGPCRVQAEHMVDGEDLLANATIAGAKMLHFIVEVFDLQLFSGVALQRIFASLLKDILVERYAVPANQIRRDGDDLFIGDGKLSISIATQSPTSTLMHFALNVVNEGTPVKTSCLQDWKVPTEELAQFVGKAFAQEFLSIKAATQKVRWVQ